MLISSRFNRFYHGVVLKDLFEKLGHIEFKEFLIQETNDTLKIYKYEDYSDIDELKQLLKLLNLDYKVNESGDKKVSTIDINSKELCEHIEWVIKLTGENGCTLDFINKEWQRLLNEYKNL